MLLTGRNLPYIPLAKKHYSCKETIQNVGKMQYISYRLMGSSLSLVFLHGICFEQTGFVSSKTITTTTTTTTTIPEINTLFLQKYNI